MKNSLASINIASFMPVKQPGFTANRANDINQKLQKCIKFSTFAFISTYIYIIFCTENRTKNYTKPH